MDHREKRKHVRTIVMVVALALFLILALLNKGTGGENNYYSTFWALVPPIIAIVLALLTREVYSSLFVGILSGALLYANFNLEKAVTAIFSDGIIAKLSDEWNIGILIFLVFLGILVALINKTGGSAAYGKWAAARIKSRTGALLATTGLGVLIFVDDYFNCLTVGSVMRPVTDKHKISRAKLAYLIDSTAAPVCIIAPISSWAAAVAGVVDNSDGLGLSWFMRAIPYNYYALLTILMMIVLAVLKLDFGPMKLHEKNAVDNNDIYTTPERPFADAEAEIVTGKGKIIDLVLPVVVLIACCIAGMVYTGGFFSGVPFITAFAECDASLGLALGSFVTLIFAFCFFVFRGVLSFKEFSEAIPKGFIAMVPAILILILAWTLSGITGLLGGDIFVSGILENSAGSLNNFIPIIVFLLASGLSFATGTSWGTFGILLPIAVSVIDPSSELMVITISACLAGAVFGDHCSPISDTTIMSSTGAQCDHINHVSTQLPYASLVAGISLLMYFVTGFVQNALITLPIAMLVMICALVVIKKVTGSRRRA